MSAPPSDPATREQAAGGGLAGPAGEEQEADALLATDLSDLPGPGPAAGGRRGRHPAIMLIVIALSALLGWLYWDDAVYFGRPETPLELGNTVAYKARFDQQRAFDPQFPHNSFVRISGLTLLASSADGGRRAFFKLAYVPVFVQADPALARAAQGPLTYVTVSGRLRALSRTGRFGQLQQFYREKFGVSFEHAYLLEAGRTPADAWWAPLLLLLCATFAGANTVLLVRHLRRR